MHQFTLVRHGESTGNAGAPYTTRGAPPLTERGWEQARSAAATFDAAPSLIVASEMVRAQQTAQPLRDRFPDVPFAVWPVHEFMPLPDRFYQNMRQADRKEQFYGFFDGRDPAARMEPHTESFAMGIGRAVSLLERVSQQPDVVVFAHGTFLKMVYWTWLMGSQEHATRTMAACGKMLQVMPLTNCVKIRGTVDDFGRIYLTPPT